MSTVILYFVQPCGCKGSCHVNVVICPCQQGSACSLKYQVVCLWIGHMCQQTRTGLSPARDFCCHSPSKSNINWPFNSDLVNQPQRTIPCQTCFDCVPFPSALYLFMQWRINTIGFRLMAWEWLPIWTNIVWGELKAASKVYSDRTHNGNTYGKLLKLFGNTGIIYLAFFNTDVELEEGSCSSAGDATHCRVSFMFLDQSTLVQTCVTGHRMRADRCGRRHVGPKGKLFRTKMLTEESIDINSTFTAREKKTIGKTNLKKKWWKKGEWLYISMSLCAQTNVICEYMLASVKQVMENMYVSRQCTDWWRKEENWQGGKKRSSQKLSKVMGEKCMGY